VNLSGWRPRWFIIAGMPPRKHTFGSFVTSDAELLEAALFGLEHRRTEIEEKMAELRRQLGGRAGSVTRMGAGTGATTAGMRKRRTLSAAARRLIAAAQRKRWAALKKGQASKAAPVKRRKLSAAGKKRIAEATRKRWAKFRATKAAAAKRAAGK